MKLRLTREAAADAAEHEYEDVPHEYWRRLAQDLLALHDRSALAEKVIEAAGTVADVAEGMKGGDPDAYAHCDGAPYAFRAAMAEWRKDEND